MWDVRHDFFILDHIPVGIMVVDQNAELLFCNRVLKECSCLSAAEIANKPLSECFPYFTEPKNWSRLEELFQHGFPVFFSFQLHGSAIPAKTGNGQERFQHVTVMPVQMPGGSETVALFTFEGLTGESTGQDRSCRGGGQLAVQEYVREKASLERRAIQQLTVRLAGPLTFEQMGKIVAEESSAIFEHDAFLLLLNNEDEKMLRVVYAEDILEGASQPAPVTMDDAVPHTSVMYEILDGFPKLINRRDEQEEPKYIPFGNEARRSKSLMYVPIRWESLSIGVLSVQSYKSERYGEEDLQLLQIFADQCGGALTRVKADQLRKETEHRLSFILEASQDGIVLFGDRMKLLFCNQRFADLLGYSKEECFSLDFANLIHPEYREMIISNNHRRMQGENIQRTYDFRILRRNGEVLDIEGSFDLIQKDDVRLGVLGFIRDVTARKSMEEQLRQSQELYHSLVSSLPQGIFRKDIHGRYTFVNQKFCKELGLSEKEIIGKTDYDFFPRKLADKYWTDEQKVLDNDQIYESVEELKFSVNDSFYLHIIKLPIRDDNNQITGLQGMFWDVTDRIQSQESLTRIWKAVENSSDAISIVDNNLKNVYYNKTFLDLFGYSPGELTSRGGAEFLYVEQDIAKTVKASLVQGKSWNGEIQMRTITGQVLPVSLRADSVKDENGVVVGRIGIYSDITQRKQYEEGLKKAIEDSQAANRAKSEFLANMSHEIRTPMNGIIGMTELALDTNLSPEQREYLELVKDSAESLLLLINDILDFSKIEAGKVEFYNVNFNLRDCINNFVQSVALRAAQKNIELVHLISQDVPEFMNGDPHRLRQVLTNLVGNAIKFTEAGEIILRADLLEASGESLRLMFSICDTGIGIPKEMQGVIFDAFEQVDKSSTRQYGGTGLGLAISRKLIEMMNGSISVDSPWQHPDRSEGGDGSRFRFDACFQRVTHEQGTSRVKPVFSNQCILVIAKNKFLQKVFSEMMMQWNIQCFCVSTLDEAEQLIQNHSKGTLSFAALFLDSSVDAKNILEFIDDLKSVPGLLSSSVVMINPAKKNELVFLFKDLGLPYNLTKPVLASEVYTLLNHILNPSEQRGAYRKSRGAIVQAGLKQVISSGRILLAEDNPVNQKLAIRILEKNGQDVMVANDGQEAVELLRQHQFDMVLMDIQMPNMDGFSATREIREYEESEGKQHMPIIALTAHAMKGDRERCIEAGMDDYLSKPIKPKELTRLLTKYLGGNG